MAERSKTEDIDYMVRFLEGVLEKSPQFIEALAVLGGLYTKKGDFEKGLAIDKRLSMLKPEDPVVFYNLACSYSLLNEIEKALGYIRQAIDFGYDDLKFLEEDKDLTNLRKDSRFLDYIIGIKNKKPENSNNPSDKI